MRHHAVCWATWLFLASGSMAIANQRSLTPVGNAEELAAVLVAADMSSARHVEIHLRDSTTLRWKGLRIDREELTQREAPYRKVALQSVDYLRIAHSTGSRTRRIVGGIAGFLVGALVGSTCALGISDSHGADGIATVVLVATPVAGAWIGQRLGRGGMSFTTIFIRNPAGPPGSAKSSSAPVDQ
jgi:hypothetical protein